MLSLFIDFVLFCLVLGFIGALISSGLLMVLLLGACWILGLFLLALGSDNGSLLMALVGLAFIVIPTWLWSEWLDNI